MGASRFVGRVGGLAAALGVGAALYAGCGVAWADTADPGASAPDSTSAPARNHRAPAKAAAATAKTAPRQQRTSDRRATTPAVTTPQVSDPASASGVTPAAAAPLDTPLASALTAVARRQPTAAAVASAQASATTSPTVSSNGVSVAPTVDIVDGIIYGNLNATSERGATLTFKSLGGEAGGKLALGTGPTVDPANPDLQDFTALPYATWLDAGSQLPSGTEQFKVRVSEVTGFDTFITGIPLVGLIASPIIDLLQQLPLISTILAPLIGGSMVAAFNIETGTLSAAKPVAYTYDVTSFDGTKISANWFPSVDVAAHPVGDVQAETILNGPGLATPGQTNPYAVWGINNQTLGVGTLRTTKLLDGEGDPTINGYNVLSWDPRGEFASGGVLQLDNPFFEGRDVSALVDFIAANDSSKIDSFGDPKVGMVGGSYGGGIQLTAASTDPRIDAIVPDIAWNSLNSSLYPSDTAFKTAYGSLLLLSLVTTGARINPQIYNGVISGDLLGWVSQRSQAVLASSGPTTLLNQLQTPALLTQGTVDVLFPLQQSLDNIQTILDNTYDTAAKLVWFCGGHGVCADFTSDSPEGQAQAALLRNDALAWLSQYVHGVIHGYAPADLLPNFQWVDQLGNINNSGLTNGLLPYEDGFNDLPAITGTNAGGLLGIVPLLGGSGPGPGTLPYSLGNGSTAGNAINVNLTVPVDTQVVGAPELSFTYSGLGTSRAVYAQIVDKSTGRVLGNVVTPVPVTLDGRQHTVDIPLSDIAYTYGGTTDPGQLTLQITTSATAYANLTAFGLINISDINVALPNRNPN